MNLVREVNAGARIALCAWIVEIEDKQVAAFGLRIYDDLEHPCCIYGPCRTFEQVRDLGRLCSSRSFPLQIHNEIFVPVLQARCKIDADPPFTALDSLTADKYPPSDQIDLRRTAMDVIANAMDHNDDDPRVKRIWTRTLNFETSTNLAAHFIGSGTVSLDHSDEGGELELLVLQAFESLCPFGAFMQPEVLQGNKRRELCDVLAVSRVRRAPQEGIFIVQSKVAAAPVPDQNEVQAGGLRRSKRTFLRQLAN